MAPRAKHIAGIRLAILIEGALGIVAVVLAWLASVRFRELFPVSTADMLEASLRGAAATLPLLAAFWWLVHTKWPAAQRLHRQAVELVDELFHGASIVQLAFVAILAGISEELLFRGFLQSLAGRLTTPLIGLVIASLVFGAFHALSRLYFTLATLVGAYFGWLFVQYDDLIAPMVAHALYDFVALVYLCWARPDFNHESLHPRETTDERTSD